MTSCALLQSLYADNIRARHTKTLTTESVRSYLQNPPNYGTLSSYDKMIADSKKKLMSLTRTKKTETDKIDGYCECKCRYVMFLVRQDRRTVVHIVIADGVIQIYIQFVIE